MLPAPAAVVEGAVDVVDAVVDDVAGWLLVVGA